MFKCCTSKKVGKVDPKPASSLISVAPLRQVSNHDSSNISDISGTPAKINIPEEARNRDDSYNSSQFPTIQNAGPSQIRSPRTAENHNTLKNPNKIATSNLALSAKANSLQRNLTTKLEP